MSDATAFVLLASIVVSFLAASSPPTPIYALYQAEWGFSPITTTIVFGVYALAVLGSLLTVGSLSDYIGRRPVLLAAIAMQAVAMVLFTTASGVPSLLTARVVQGLSTGAAVGAVGAGMLDLDRARGAIANSITPMIGTATGGIVSGLMVHFLPAPTHLVYLVLLVVFALQGVGVLSMSETVSRRPGALASLRPQLHLPSDLHKPVVLAAPLLVAAWSLAGLYGSLGPMLVRSLVGSNSALLGGLALFTFAASGALVVLLVGARAPRTMMTSGSIGLLVGVALTLLSLSVGSVVVFFLAAVIAGAGFGTGFQGAIRSVVPLAAPEVRAGVLSVLFVISYLAMGLPAVLAGVRVVYGHGLLNTAYEYGAMVITLSVFALVGVLVQRPRTVA